MVPQLINILACGSKHALLRADLEAEHSTASYLKISDSTFGTDTRPPTHPAANGCLSQFEMIKTIDRSFLPHCCYVLYNTNIVCETIPFAITGCRCTSIKAAKLA